MVFLDAKHYNPRNAVVFPLILVKFEVLLVDRDETVIFLFIVPHQKGFLSTFHSFERITVGFMDFAHSNDFEIGAKIGPLDPQKPCIFVDFW